MDFLKEIKQGINKIKDKLTKTELQRLLKESTSNEHCHANVSLLDEISSKTHNYNDFRVIVAHCLKKLDCKKEKWRKILKSLFLIEHILKTGSPNFYDSMRSEISKFKYLHSFSFVDTNKSDKGETIREKSRVIVDLLEHKDKLKEEREKYSKWKSRIEGVSSSGKMGSTSYTSYSGDNFGSSVSSSNYSNTYAGSRKNRRDSPDLSSSSSEDEKEKKKKHKKGKDKKKDSSGEEESSDEDKNKKNKKSEKQASKKDQEENNVNNNLKPTSNISLKKPSSSANRKAEAESLFQMQQGSSGNQSKANTGNLISIDDLLGGSANNYSVPVNNQNNNNNNNNIFDSSIFGAPVNNTQNISNVNANNNNNIIDFGFVVSNNNNNQAQNTNANTDLFSIGNSGNVQSNANQPSKPTGGFNTDDLLKNMYSNNNNTSSNNAFNNAFGNPSSHNANAFQNMQFNNPNMNLNANIMGAFSNSYPGAPTSGPNNNMNMNINNNYNMNMNSSGWGYNAQNHYPNANNHTVNTNLGFNTTASKSANFNFDFGNNSNPNNNTKKKIDDDEFCEVVEEDSKNVNKNTAGKSDIMSLLSGIGSDNKTNQNRQNSSSNNNSNTNFNFY